jgi:hypothetical protein
MREPGPDDVDPETWRDPQLASLEANLADESPGPPASVGAARKSRFVLVILTCAAGEAKDVVVV